MADMACILLGGWIPHFVKAAFIFFAVNAFHCAHCSMKKKSPLCIIA
jgi:hypothetical protein